MLLELTPNPAMLQQPVTPAAFASAAPLWAYLDKLHPNLWRKGLAFPASVAEMHRMLGDGELKLSLTFNPNEGANLIASQQLPATSYSFGFTGGTIGNVHFVAIPVNARAKAAAQVFANFLLSVEAQTRKADIAVWGDGVVLDVQACQRTSPDSQNRTRRLERGRSHPAEPHASWVEALKPSGSGATAPNTQLAITHARAPTATLALAGGVAGCPGVWAFVARAGLGLQPGA